MIVVEARVCIVVLCPEHFTRMSASEVKWAVPSFDGDQMTPSRCCREVTCCYTYSVSSGYFRYRKDQPIQSEKSLWKLCPEHRRPLRISEFDKKNRVATWRCPVARCGRCEKRQMR